MTKDQIIQAWKSVFPGCHVSVSNGALGGGLYIKGYLLSSNQWKNGISHNDPLNFLACIENDVYEEQSGYCYIQVKPQSNGLYCSSVKIRKKTIKQVDIESLTKRFNELKKMVNDNIDNMLDDVKGMVKQNIQI